jgi:hypothetical protein
LKLYDTFTAAAVRQTESDTMSLPTKAQMLKLMADVENTPATDTIDHTAAVVRLVNAIDQRNRAGLGFQPIQFNPGIIAKMRDRLAFEHDPDEPGRLAASTDADDADSVEQARQRAEAWRDSQLAARGLVSDERRKELLSSSALGRTILSGK